MVPIATTQYLGPRRRDFRARFLVLIFMATTPALGLAMVLAERNAVDPHPIPSHLSWRKVEIEICFQYGVG
jgi:hypothetical protein